MAMTSTVTESTSILWDDGTTFDGYLVFLCVVPATHQSTGPNGEVISQSPTVAKSNPQQFYPLFTILPIRNGTLGSSASLLRTDHLNPRGCKYKVYMFDASWTQKTGVTGLPASLFTITADTYSVTLGPVSTSASDGSVTVPQLMNNPYAIGSGSGTVSQSNVYVFNQTITAIASSVTYSVLSQNTILLMILTADGSGTMPTFGAEFQDVDPSDFNPTSGKRSTFMFVSTGSVWQAISARSVV